MSKSKYWTYGVLLLMLTGVLTVLAMGQVDQVKSPKSQVSNPKPISKPKPNGKGITQKEPPAKVAIIHTKVGGWGFLKNTKHETPGITAEQEELVRQHNAMFVGDESKKEVTVTFDLGYENGYTGRILDTLKTNNVQAIFFITGPWLKENPELAKRMVEEGHIIGNHTWSHPSLPTISKENMEADINRLQEYIEKTTGQNNKVKYLRPPKGEYSEQTLRWTKEMGYTTVMWSVALRDWVPMGSPQEAIDGVRNNLHNGAIILLHAVSKDVTEGLDTILKSIREQGYKIVPINKLSPRKY